MGGEDLNITLYFWLHGASPPFKEFLGPPAERRARAAPSFAGRAGFAVGRWSRLDRRRLEPAGWFPTRSRAGIQAFSRESPDAKSRGGCPRPQFRARSLPLARFGVGCHIVPVDGLLRHPCTCPDLETFFHKMLFQHIFPENASQIGVRISDEIAPPPDQRQRSQKRASGGKRAIKPGVQGLAPGPLSPHFSGEMGTPCRAGGAPGQRAPRVLRSHPPEGYALGPLVPPGMGEPSELPL